jgi:chromate reductase
MAQKIGILGFGGSLRKGSYSLALLRAAVELAPEDASLEIFELGGIPPFNQDLETSPPDTVKEFKRKIRAADAILITTPEYNYSVPGVLKNAIDWASRPYGDNSFEDQGRGHYELLLGYAGWSQSPVPPAAVMCFPGHAPGEPAGGVC